MNVGQRIRYRREQLGLSQEDVAKVLGYRNRSSVNKIELAGYKVPSDKIMEFAKALHTTPAYLMGWEDEQGNEIPDTDTSLIQELYDQLTIDDQDEIIELIRYKLSKKRVAGTKETASA